MNETGYNGQTMLQNIKVIAFDIDGTLYPSFSLYRRLVFYVLKNLRFYIHFNRVRNIMHKTGPLPDFYEYQGRLLAEELHCTVEEAKEKIQKIVYGGLTPFFEKISTFKDVEESFIRFKEAGYKIAVLSDFPPSQKGTFWNLGKYCDLICGSEEIGALKPSKYPFGVLAQKMGVTPEEVLYVGNSFKYDVCGSKNAGMMSAWIIPWWKKILKSKKKSADINFSTYRQLIKFVLD